jgi:CubicO group peptidase (beta-lactamase class C family)
MIDSYLLDHAALIRDRAIGYRDKGFGFPRFERSVTDIPMVGDGGVLSSAADMLRFVEALIGNRITRNAHVLFEPGQLDDGTTLGYGRGFIVESLADGQKWVGHTGGWLGTSTLVGCYLPSGTAITVLSNDEHARVVKIAQQVIRWHG